MSSQCFPNTSETTLHKINTCAMLAQSLQTCISQENNLCNCLDLPVPTLYKKVTCAMFAYSPQTTLDRKVICNFVWICLGQYCISKLPAECYEKNNVYKAVLTMMGQHYIRILSSQCSLNTPETALHKKIACADFRIKTGRFKYVWWPVF